MSEDLRSTPLVRTTCPVDAPASPHYIFASWKNIVTSATKWCQEEQWGKFCSMVLRGCRCRVPADWYGAISSTASGRDMNTVSVHIMEVRQKMMLRISRWPCLTVSAISKNVPTKKETAAEPKPGCRNDEPCAKLRSRQIRQVWNRLFQSCPYTCPVGTTNGKFLIKSKGRIQVNDPVSFLRTECVEYGDVASQKKKTYNTGVTEYRITGMVGNR